ncbi:MAG TPA: DUF1684 domain-containing protein, partial [Actinotalea sp.]
MEHPAWTVVDWRRSVADLYRRVRELEPAEGHDLWVGERRRLLSTHPASPVPADQRAGFRGGQVAAYDASFRFVVPVREAAPERREVVTGTDGVVVFERIGRVDLPDLGTLDLWWLTSYGGGLFLPLRDLTSGDTSYGGGRYLLDT